MGKNQTQELLYINLNQSTVRTPDEKMAVSILVTGTDQDLNLQS
jgi:hypothetical protein